MIDCSTSIVTYKNPSEMIRSAVESFFACSLQTRLYVVDNSPKADLGRLFNGLNATYYFYGRNVGYGKAHNWAIRNSEESKYHLVMNPDIIIHEGTLEKLVAYMEQFPEVGLISPKILNEDGSIQYLNKRLPTVSDLFARRFLPTFIQRITIIKKRMDHYIMLGEGYEDIRDIPYITGCFMLFRTSVLKKLGGFDEKFFMYLEEADITRRVNQAGYKSIYYPYATVTHKWARGSHNSLKLTYITIKSAFYYFNKWGWKWI